ncbi:unnamed protein product [Cuscuta campestris]|uniref:CCHC-type domain-containing protein n=1 Tax=Cuscuta campestris TaxID=132261 RepID=A0A484MSY9_9ASTE|nr:unnamed protein product [Cuscuta campestris]
MSDREDSKNPSVHSYGSGDRSQTSGSSSSSSSDSEHPTTSPKKKPVHASTCAPSSSAAQVVSVAQPGDEGFILLDDRLLQMQSSVMQKAQADDRMSTRMKCQVKPTEADDLVAWETTLRAGDASTRGLYHVGKWSVYPGRETDPEPEIVLTGVIPEAIPINRARGSKAPVTATTVVKFHSKFATPKIVVEEPSTAQLLSQPSVQPLSLDEQPTQSQQGTSQPVHSGELYINVDTLEFDQLMEAGQANQLAEGGHNEEEAAEESLKRKRRKTEVGQIGEEYFTRLVKSRDEEKARMEAMMVECRKEAKAAFEKAAKAEEKLMDHCAVYRQLYAKHDGLLKAAKEADEHAQAKNQQLEAENARSAEEIAWLGDELEKERSERAPLAAAWAVQAPEKFAAQALPDREIAIRFFQGLYKHEVSAGIIDEIRTYGFESGQYDERRALYGILEQQIQGSSPRLFLCPSCMMRHRSRLSRESDFPAFSSFLLPMCNDLPPGTFPVHYCPVSIFDLAISLWICYRCLAMLDPEATKVCSEPGVAKLRTVVGEHQVPTPMDKLTTEVKKKLSLNAKALNVLFCALGQDEFARVSSCKSAKEAWKLLEATHEGDKDTKATKIALGTSEYENLKMKAGESVQDMKNRFNLIVNNLSKLNKVYPTSGINTKIIFSLPREWHSLVVNLLPKCADVETSTIWSGLYSHELLLKKMKVEEQVPIIKKTMALKIDDYPESESSKRFPSKKGKPNQITCYGCGNVGHIKPECPNLKKKEELKKGKKKALKVTWDDLNSDESDSNQSQEENANACFMASNDEEEAYADPHIIEGRTLKQDDIPVPVLELIQEQGYDDWKIMMEAHLYALHDCMWMVLEDRPWKIQMENPERNPAAPDVVQYIRKPKEKWDDRDCKKHNLDNVAKAAIFKTLDPITFSKIKYLKTAMEIWQGLGKLCEGSEDLRKQKIEVLLEKFKSFKMLPGESFDMLDERFHKILNDLASLNHILSPKEKNLVLELVIACLECGSGGHADDITQERAFIINALITKSKVNWAAHFFNSISKHLGKPNQKYLCQGLYIGHILESLGAASEGKKYEARYWLYYLSSKGENRDGASTTAEESFSNNVLIMSLNKSVKRKQVVSPSRSTEAPQNLAPINLEEEEEFSDQGELQRKKKRKITSPSTSGHVNPDELKEKEPTEETSAHNRSSQQLEEEFPQVQNSPTSSQPQVDDAENQFRQLYYDWRA